MTHPHEGLQERALKPCPFCGGDELSHGYTMAGGQMIGNAECHTCGVYIVAEDEASAIENWNTCADPLTGTPPVPQDQGLRDALEKKLIEAQAIVSCMAHRPSCVLGDDMCLCGLSQLDRVLRLPAETTLPQQAATDEGEELPYQSDDWKLRGYPSAAAEIEDMANVGRALMHAIEKDYAADLFMKGWHPADCPTEIVGDLLNALAEASTPTSQPPAAETRMALEALIEKRVPKGMDQWVRDLAREAFELAALTQPEPAAETRLRDMMAKLAASYATALKPAAGWTADQVGWWEIGVADAASAIACAIRGTALTQPEPTAQQGGEE